MKAAASHLAIALICAVYAYLLRHYPPVWPALGWFFSGFNLCASGHALALWAAAEERRLDQRLAAAQQRRRR